MEKEKRQLIDVNAIRRHAKPKADSTLRNMRKEELIEYIRMLEYNFNVSESFLDQQAKNFEAMNAAEVEKAMEWLQGYTMTDTKQVYSNGCVYVPLFRVRQAFEDKAYNGLREG